VENKPIISFIACLDKATCWTIFSFTRNRKRSLRCLINDRLIINKTKYTLTQMVIKLIAFLQLFAGLLLNVESILPWLAWIKYLSVAQYGFSVSCLFVYLFVCSIIVFSMTRNGSNKSSLIKLRAVHKRRLQSRGGKFVHCGYFVTTGEGLLQCGRPKIRDFSKILVCPHGQEGGS